jgi:hypothetical protein
MMSELALPNKAFGVETIFHEPLILDACLERRSTY